MRRFLWFIYRYGLLAAVYKAFQRGYEPHGMGLCYLLRYGVCRVGAKVTIPTRRCFVVNRTLKSATDVDIVLTHGLGGGAESYLSHKISTAPPSRAIFVIKPTHSVGLYSVDLYLRDKKVIWFFVVGLEAFAGLAGRKCRIIINELVGWPTKGKVVCNETFSLLVGKLLVLKERLGAGIHYLLHDYYCICPKYTLVDPSGAYCRSEVDMERCPDCLRTMAWNEAVSSVRQWREDYLRLLAACEKVISFSKDSKERLQKCYRGLSVEVLPHELPVQLKQLSHIKELPLVIGVVGSLYPEKGLHIVKSLAEYISHVGRNDVRIKIVGTVPRNVVMPSNVDVHGHYDVQNLSAIIENEGINLAFVSSVCVETFSYVTKELIALGLPIVCFDLGAQRDHVASYSKGAIIPEISAKSTWDTILRLYDKVYGTGQLKVAENKEVGQNA